MFISPISTVRALVVPAVLSAALAVGACGSNDAKVQQVREDGAKLQQQGQQLQRDAAKTAADVQAGRVSADQASKDLEAKTDKLTKSVKTTASDAIDAAKDDSRVPDEAKQALEDAQAQLQAP